MKSPGLIAVVLLMAVSWSLSSNSKFYANSFIAYKLDSSQNLTDFVQGGSTTTSDVNSMFYNSSENDSVAMNRTLSSTLNSIKTDKQKFHNNPINNVNSVSSDDGKSWLRLSGSMGYSPILIGFIPGATDGYESNYDGEFVNEGASLEFYSYCDTYKLVTQGRTELQPLQIISVPLGFQTTAAGDYTISIVMEYIDPSFDILLEDTTKNTFTDLRVANYSFNLITATEDNDRFVIHYNYRETLASEDFVEVSNSIKPWFLYNELNTEIVSEVFPSSVRLFDVGGKELLHTSYKEKIQTYGLSSGIYVVKYGFEDSKIISKKVIKK